MWQYIPTWKALSTSQQVAINRVWKICRNFLKSQVYVAVFLDLSQSSCVLNPFKHQLYKMIKHTQINCRLLPTNCLSVFDHFLGLAQQQGHCEKNIKKIGHWKTPLINLAISYSALVKKKKKKERSTALCMIRRLSCVIYMEAKL